MMSICSNHGFVFGTNRHHCKKAAVMAFTYDIEQDALYQRGQATGQAKEKEFTTINLLKLDKLTRAEIAQITGLSLEQIEVIAKKQQS